MANILLVDDSADDREFVTQALEDEQGLGHCLIPALLT